MRNLLIKAGLTLLVCIIAFTLAVKLSAQTTQTKDGDVDCVITSVGETIVVAVDAPNKLCDADTDRTINDCEHHYLDIPRDSWPEQWGETATGRLLKGRYTGGKLKAVSACDNMGMLLRQMKANEATLYQRNPVNAGPPNPCLRGVSGFIENLLTGGTPGK